jgi:hypothetical protein
LREKRGGFCERETRRGNDDECRGKSGNAVGGEVSGEYGSCAALRGLREILCVFDKSEISGTGSGERRDRGDVAGGVADEAAGERVGDGLSEHSYEFSCPIV